MRRHQIEKSRLSFAKSRGAVAPLVAVCLPVIIGATAFALDGGVLLQQRRRVQAAADAAALAAADDLFANYRTENGLDTYGTAKASALANATANGYSNDGVTSIVTVNIPPLSGIEVGQPGCAEVIVQLNQPRFFSGIFGHGAIPVIGRAVAQGKWTTFNDGIIVLDPVSQASLSAMGNGGVSVTGAWIIVDSNNAAGGVLTGNGGISAPGIAFSGTPGDSTSGGGAFTGTLLSGQTPVPDPLAYLPEPNPSNLPVVSNNTLQLSGSQSVTLNPGVYVGGINISGQTNVTLNPGIYYMEGGGFVSAGQGNLVGNQVMLYNAPGGSISIAGQGSVTITPPSTGLYQGISIFQDRASTASVSVTGNGNMNITGTFYAAHAALDIAGNGGVNVIGSQYISYDLVVAGNGAVNINWNGGPTSRTRQVGLVE
jgi:hypothetical protein